MEKTVSSGKADEDIKEMKQLLASLMREVKEVKRKINGKLRR